MSWKMTGDYYGPCSCNIGCPCLLGELEADRGWCSAMVVLDIHEGQADGTDLKGARIALAGDWPSGFLAGNGTGRLFFDEKTTDEQKAAIGPVLAGQRGGVFEVLSTLFTNFLPTETATINIEKNGDETHVMVGEHADFTMKPLRGSTGEATRVLHGAASFRDNVILGRSSGYSRPPEMRAFDFNGHAEITFFDYSSEGASFHEHESPS